MEQKSNNKNINYGFIPSEVKPEHYVLGSTLGLGLLKTVLQPLGNWEQFLPKYEPQFESFETYGCTVWGTQNALETLVNRVYQYEPNYSERYNYILARIRPPGADPHTVSESIRTKGVIDSTLLPNNTNTYEEFIKPDPMTKELIDKGEEWLYQYDFGHEWVFSNSPNKATRLSLLKEALQYSPVCLSVTAWNQNSSGLYTDNGQPNNHWCMCYGIEGESPLIFDSYDQSKKKLHPDHQIMMAKRYYIGPSTRKEKLDWISHMLQWILVQLGIIQKKVNEMPTVKPGDLNIPPEAPKMPVVERDLINEYCTAISIYEGKPGDLNHRNCNPGNLKNVDGTFMRFQTWEEGMQALRAYVIRACTGKHKAYKPEFTIYQFFAVYAPSSDKNNPKKYAEWVAKRLNISPTMQIKKLL